jgi:nicotinamide-nucleotide amidase
MKKEMLRISLLTIGDEILIGQTVNTNASWIGDKVTKLGAKVVVHSSISDDKSAIIDELNRLSGFSDIILITGGLGPTHDDITKHVLAEYFGMELELNQELLSYLEGFFAKRGRVMNELNKKQALVPKGCKLLNNSVGTAPAMLFENEFKKFISMPGVPTEMKAIMNEEVLPLIANLLNIGNYNIVAYQTIQTFGIPESNLAEKIGLTSNFLEEGGSLAYLPSYRGVKLRLGTEADSFEVANSKLADYTDYIKAKISDNILSIGEENVVEVLRDLVIKHKLSISVAESCTGGLLGGAITALEGSSEYFMGGEIVYSNTAKIERLCVLESTLEKYGAVSTETALEMCRNIARLYNTNIGISITGIAGPGGGSIDKPVGTVCIGVIVNGITKVEQYRFGNNREINRELSISYACGLAIREIRKQFENN